MAPYSEKELRYARPLAHALFTDPLFRAWFVDMPEMQHAPHDPKLQACLRSPNMKTPYWFNYWCGKDTKCACRIGTGIETDILLIFQSADTTNTAIHIEVKRPGDTLVDGQALSYPRRAACWSNPAT